MSDIIPRMRPTGGQFRGAILVPAPLNFTGKDLSDLEPRADIHELCGGGWGPASYTSRVVHF